MGPPNPIYTPAHKELVRLLREERQHKGLRQVDVGAALGRPQSYISAYETGHKVLDFIEVWRICEILGVPFSKFIRRFERAVLKPDPTPRRRQK